MKYFHWDEKVIDDFSERNITEMYEGGYLFTRVKKGLMHQTRSLRIDLSEFELSSENRRILKKTEAIGIEAFSLPYEKYDWRIAKLAKDFYDKKFGPGIMSAQKIKEMLTSETLSNFNALLSFSEIGYAICYKNSALFHYSYPFYDLEKAPKDMGLGMMTKAVMYAKDMNVRYVYLGSLQRPTDTYKLQFSGLEWFDGNNWNSDLEVAKKNL